MHAFGVKTCDTCKWWGSEKYKEDETLKFDYRLCNHPKLFPNGEAPEDGLTDAGMDAGYQDLITGPKFGCIHHEALVQQDPPCLA